MELFIQKITIVFYFYTDNKNLNKSNIKDDSIFFYTKNENLNKNKTVIYL